MASLCGGRELKWTISRILSVHHSLSVLDRGQGHGAGWGVWVETGDKLQFSSNWQHNRHVSNVWWCCTIFGKGTFVHVITTYNWNVCLSTKDLHWTTCGSVSMIFANPSKCGYIIIMSATVWWGRGRKKMRWEQDCQLIPQDKKLYITATLLIF